MWFLCDPVPLSLNIFSCRSAVGLPSKKYLNQQRIAQSEYLDQRAVRFDQSKNSWPIGEIGTSPPCTDLSEYFGALGLVTNSKPRETQSAYQRIIHTISVIHTRPEKPDEPLSQLSFSVFPFSFLGVVFVSIYSIDLYVLKGLIPACTSMESAN